MVASDVGLGAGASAADTVDAAAINMATKTTTKRFVFNASISENVLFSPSYWYVEKKLDMELG